MKKLKKLWITRFSKAKKQQIAYLKIIDTDAYEAAFQQLYSGLETALDLDSRNDHILKHAKNKRQLLTQVAHKIKRGKRLDSMELQAVGIINIR